MTEISPPLAHEQQEKLPAPERVPELPDAAHAEALRHGEVDPVATLNRLNEAHEAIAEATEHEAQPNPLAELQAAENTRESPPPRTINQELKSITLRRELQQVRRKLPLPERTLSRAIHTPAVRLASEATGRTITRPSGLLGGGVVAFMGTTIYFYLAKHIGFTYNYAIFLILVVVGFAVGVALETLAWALIANRRRRLQNQ